MNAAPIDPDDTIDFAPVQGALRPGIYRRADGEIFRVQLNSERSKVYTMRWVKRGDGFVFAYAPEAISTLTAADGLPIDEAREMSRKANQCIACAAPLTDPKSQALGVGPKCAKNWTKDEIPNVIERVLRRIPASPKQSVRARVDGDRIIITSQYDRAIVGIIKTFRDPRWNGETWSLPREHAHELANAFAAAGIAYDDVAAIAMEWMG